VPGTDKWIPLDEDPEAMEDVPGALIVRLRENLDFGVHFLYLPLCVRKILTCPSELANTAQLKGALCACIFSCMH
jgi:hypothetical protein